MDRSTSRQGGSLLSWFAIFHRRYRSVLTQAMLAGTAASGLVYLDDTLLGWITSSLADPGQGKEMPVPMLVGDLANRLGIGLPFLLVAFFFVNRLVTAGIGFWQIYCTGVLNLRGKADLEREILTHLLRKDDAFFGRHSPAETVNRLSIDLQRICARRPNLMMFWWSALLIIGNLTYFVVHDLRLSLVALASCVLGGFWASTMSGRVKQTDARYLHEDDQVKRCFEDYLRAFQEVQVGKLQDKVTAHLGQLQEHRGQTFRRYVIINESVAVGNLMANLLAFVAMLLVVIYMRKSGAVSRALMLIPVIIHTLPYLIKQQLESLLSRRNIAFFSYLWEVYGKTRCACVQKPSLSLADEDGENVSDSDGVVPIHHRLLIRVKEPQRIAARRFPAARRATVDDEPSQVARTARVGLVYVKVTTDSAVSHHAKEVHSRSLDVGVAG